MNNPLLDNDFLIKLNNQKNKTIYAKIIALTFEEYANQEISGIVQSGSINIDGDSAIRRTCSLTLISNLNNINQPNFSLNDYYWGLNTKFKLYIGVENKINDIYDDIIWFSQGIFLITNFSSVLNTNGFTINISGKDKMCLLNGDVGGIIPMENCFGILEDYNEETNSNDIIDLPIETIIREAVHTYGREEYRNIIINDIEDGKELLEYQGEDDLFLIIEHNREATTYLELRQGTDNCYLKDGTQTILSQLSNYEIVNKNLDDSLVLEKPTPFWFNQTINEDLYYTALKVTTGMSIGYKETELTYPNAENLIIKPGESVVSLLDKIVKIFSDYEYFYNIDGQFVFQKKKTYLNTSFNNLKKDFETGEVYGDSAANTSAVTYNFEDGTLITSYNNTPNLGNVKNDFVCWGNRKTNDNTEIPIHMRYAIDTKPEYYMSIEITIDEIQSNKTYKNMPAKKNKINQLIADNPQEILYQKSQFYFSQDWYNRQSSTIQAYLDSLGLEPYDWREIIYRMAFDYFQYNLLPTYYHKLKIANQYNNINSFLKSNIINENKYQNNQTGYEQYYTDIQGFWRQLYDPELKYDYKTVYSLQDKTLYYIKEEYRKINNTQELIEQAQDNEIYIARSYDNENTFLVPLLDCIDLIYKVVNNREILSEGQDLFVTDKNNNKTIVTVLNGIKKQDLYKRISKKDNNYKKLVENIIINNSNGGASNCQIYIENDQKHTIPVTLKQAIESGKVYCKIEDGNFIEPMSYYKNEQVLYNLYCTSNNQYKENFNIYVLEKNGYEFSNKYSTINNTFYQKIYTNITEGTNKYWNKSVFENPSSLNFWFDMLTTEGGLSQYAIPNLGDRVKVDNNNEIKAIYYEDIPTVIFHYPDEYKNIKTLRDNSGYDHIWLSNLDKENMVLSGQSISAKNAIDNLIYNYIHCNETVSLTTIPIYYLEPNTRIYIHDPNTQIIGEYIVNKISVPLTYNETMNITATKAVQRLN